MNNKKLLLSKTGSSDTANQPNIENNKVACPHGSSTGALDKEQMFYLQLKESQKQKQKTF